MDYSEILAEYFLVSYILTFPSNVKHKEFPLIFQIIIWIPTLWFLQAVLEMSRKEVEEEDDREALNKAILQSLQTSNTTSPAVDEDDLAKAISMSLQGEIAPSQSSPAEEVESLEFIRQRRLLRLGQLSNKP